MLLLPSQIKIILQNAEYNITRSVFINAMLADFTFFYCLNYFKFKKKIIENEIMKKKILFKIVFYYIMYSLFCSVNVYNCEKFPKWLQA